MSNVSVGADIAVQALPGEPRVLLVALVYGLVQKVIAHRVVTECDAGRLLPDGRGLSTWSRSVRTTQDRCGCIS